MSGLLLTMALYAEPKVNPDLGFVKHYGGMFLGVSLNDKIEGIDYFRTGETIRIVEGFGQFGGNEMSVVRLIRWPGVKPQANQIKCVTANLPGKTAILAGLRKWLVWV